MTTINENNDEFVRIQREIIAKIQRSHNLLYYYFYTIIIFLSTFLLFIFLTMTREGILKPVSYLSGAFLILVFGLMYLKTYWPLLKEVNHSVKHMEEVNLENSKDDFNHVVISYLNNLFFLLYHSTSSTKQKPKLPDADITKKIHSLLTRHMFVNGILGAAVLFFFALIIIFEPWYVKTPRFFISCLSIFGSYSFMLAITIMIKNDVQKWLKGYSKIEQWGQELNEIQLI
ncbi:MAG: hypothetical protein ACW97Z_11115 [Candidatus Hodarchaeales archaeon]|jgi:hypothetical protein